jgi:hypothetical protein
VDFDYTDRAEYTTATHQCGSCGGTTLLPLEDGLCPGCVNLLWGRPKGEPSPRYLVSFYHEDGTYDETLELPKARAEWWRAHHPERCKVVVTTLPAYSAGSTPAAAQVVQPEAGSPAEEPVARLASVVRGPE